MRISPAGLFGFDPKRFQLSFNAKPTAQNLGGNRPNLTADLARQLLDLRGFLGDLRGAASMRKTSGSSARITIPATAVSAKPLQVTTVGSPTTLQTNGLLGSPTSLVELTKSFSGTSTSQGILNGSYDGSLGSQVELTFTVTKGGILGQNDVQLEVFDDQGTKLDQLKIEKENPGEVFSLSMGLDVRFTAGELNKNETFSLDLSTSNGVLDPDQAFQGSGLPGSGSFQTVFEQGSTAIPTLSGQYTGAFDDTLRFEVTRAGVVGQDDVEIEVFDGGGQKLGKLQFKKALAPGTALSLSNGLTLALSPGAVVKSDQFYVSVQADDQAVFSEGLEVQAGTLVINGTAIAVDQLDSVRTLADKITSSAAGVKAFFDPASGEFRLTNKVDGPAAISLGADDTGFFAAIGLDSGLHVPGTVAGTSGVTKLTELQGLTSGTFSINGEVVSVDVDNDTLDDVLARINSLAGEVEATYVGNRLRLRSSEAFDLQNGTSAFFDAVEIDTGLYEATERTRRVLEEGLQDPFRLKGSLGSLERSLNRVFALPSSSQLPGASATLLEAIRSSFDGAGENSYSLNDGLGLRFQLQNTADVLTIDSSVLERALSKRSEELSEFLLGGPGGEQDPGLVDRLSTAIDKVLDQLVAQLDPIHDGSLLLDIKA